MKKNLIIAILGLLALTLGTLAQAAEHPFFRMYGARSTFQYINVQEERMSDAEAAVPKRSQPNSVYRITMTCWNNQRLARERIEAQNGFSNYTCGNRKNFMCYQTGLDYYFVEFCDYGNYSPTYTTPNTNTFNYRNQGNNTFGQCLATGNFSEWTTCSDYCATQSKSCLNYGCVHPNETNSRFGAIFYNNNYCSGSPTKNFQCWDRFAPQTGTGAKCCCK